MTESTLIVRMSKSAGIYNKNNTYEIRLNNGDFMPMNYQNNRMEFRLPNGKHTVTIKNEVTTHETEFELRYEKTKVLTINPSVTYKLFMGFMIGMALCSSCISLFIAKKVMPTLLMIPFIPLLFVKKKNFAPSFMVTEK
ncbi:hypothetical protein [Flavobacterium sp. TSSA_36]|uniref:hypothetical protein n=1 Tax=Flavobacterium sp. TSSA_36 TaxID=3447669 RepID=UPI003F40A6B6